jgi:hypothetical protein
VLFLALTLGNRGQVKRRVHARTHACTHAQQDHTQEGSTGRGGGGQAGANLIGWPLPISRLGQSQSEGLHIHIVFREPSFSLGLPTIAALRAKRLARVGQARKKFGSHYVLYYVLHSAVLKIATRRLPRAQNPKDARCWTEFCDYLAFRAVFKSFRVLSRNGKSVRENYCRTMARCGHSQRLLESRPRREVRGSTCLDGEPLQFWADFQLLHLKSTYGGDSIVARAGEHATPRF